MSAHDSDTVASHARQIVADCGNVASHARAMVRELRDPRRYARVQIQFTAVVVVAPAVELTRALCAVDDAHAAYDLATPRLLGTTSERAVIECHTLLTGDVLASALLDLLGSVEVDGWPARIRHAVEGCGRVQDGAAWRTSAVFPTLPLGSGHRVPTRECAGCHSHVSAGQMRAVAGLA